MKKKIIFMVINMNVGGTEKALLNMIANLPKDQFDITVLMLERSGGFMNAIPDYVHVDFLHNYKDIKDALQNPPMQTGLELIQSGKMVRAFNLLLLHVLSKLRKERSLFYKYILKDIPDYQGKYDLAVAYAGPMDLISYFIANKVNAGKKVQWIHFDIDEIGFNVKFASKTYSNFNQLFVVSDKGKEKLLKKLPEFANKIDVFSNVSSPMLIKKQALEGSGFQDDFNGIRILTVGRLSIEKGQDIAIKVLLLLINAGLNVKWYCVGEGSSREMYEEMVKEYNIGDRFIFLGEDPSPYHYMMDCDMYVQPSRHEGYCITLAEAKALHKPIVTTDFTGAKEQIINNETGLIVHVDEKAIYRAINMLINEPTLAQRFSVNLAKKPTNKIPEIEKLLEFI